MSDVRAALHHRVRSDEDVGLDDNGPAVDLGGEPQTLAVRVRDVDGDEGGNVALVADGHAAPLGVHLREATYIDVLADPGLPVDPDEGMKRVLFVVNRLQEELAEACFVHDHPAVRRRSNM